MENVKGGGGRDGEVWEKEVGERCGRSGRRRWRKPDKGDEREKEKQMKEWKGRTMDNDV